MVQHKAVRYILNLKGICSISESIKELGLNTLEERRLKTRKGSLMHFLEDRERHTVLSKYFYQLSFCGINTRSCTNSKPKASRTNTVAFHNSSALIVVGFIPPLYKNVSDLSMVRVDGTGEGAERPIGVHSTPAGWVREGRRSALPVHQGVRGFSPGRKFATGLLKIVSSLQSSHKCNHSA